MADELDHSAKRRIHKYIYAICLLDDVDHNPLIFPLYTSRAMYQVNKNKR